MWATHRTLIFAAWHTLPIVRRSRFGFSDEVWLYSLGTGVWRSLVARFVRDEEAVGSNPATPTVNRRDRLVPAILYVHSQADCQHGRKGGNEAGAGGVATMQHAPTAVPEGGGRAPLRHAGGPTPSGAESSWGGGPTPLSTEKGHRHCAVTIENGDPTHQQHGRQGPHVRSSHVHNVEACITNLLGYRTLRVAGVLTFRCAGVEKSVF